MEPEERNLPPKYRDFVYEQGWYIAADQTNSFLGTHHRNVKGEFYKVGLALMLDQVHQYSTTKFPEKILERIEDSDLRLLQSELRAFAKDEKNTHWDLNKQWGEEKARALRHQSMHQSFTGFGTMIARTKNGQLERQYLPG